MRAQLGTPWHVMFALCQYHAKLSYVQILNITDL